MKTYKELNESSQNVIYHITAYKNISNPKTGETIKKDVHEKITTRFPEIKRFLLLFYKDQKYEVSVKEEK
jgi:hypothetical protein